MNDYLVAFDLGSSKVSAAVAKLDNSKKFQIAAVNFVNCNGLKKSVVVDLEKTVEAIKQCKSKLELESEIKIDDVYVSFPAGLSEIINLKAVISLGYEDKVIDKTHIKRVIDKALESNLHTEKEMIDVIPIQFFIDGGDAVIDPLGKKGKELEVEIQVYLMERETILNLARSIELAGLNIERIIAQPLAIAALINEKAEDECIAIINVDTEMIDISVCQGGGIYYTKLIPIGDNNITNDVSQCFNISNVEAEQLKIKYNIDKDIDKNEFLNYDNGIQDKNIDFTLLNEVITARVEEFLSLSLDELEKFKFYNYVDSIYVTGSGIVQYKSIVENSLKEYNKNIKILDLNLLDNFHSMHTVSIGLLKYMEKNIIQGDLFQEEISQEELFIDEISTEEIFKQEIYEEKLPNNIYDTYEEPKTNHAVKQKDHPVTQNGVISRIKNFIHDFF